MLDRWFPGGNDIVIAAEHDIIYLGITADQLATLKEDQIVELLRCGCMFNKDEGLYMFV